MKEAGLAVGIVGSREFPDAYKIGRVVETLLEKDIDFVIVSGGAEGVDSYAKHTANREDIPYLEFTPEFEDPNKYSVQPNSAFGKSYGADLYHKRNRQIARFVDLLVAFVPESHVGNPQKSRGTKSTIKKGKKCESTEIMILK